MSTLRVLAVFAHPDDESVLAGGTLAACAAAGADVHILSLTHGEAGPIERPGFAVQATLGAVREQELQAAARSLGVASAHCLDFVDGELTWASPESIGALLRCNLRTIHPDIVITFGPEGWYWHPDHVAVHEFMMAALDSLNAGSALPAVYYASWPEGHMAGLMAAVTAGRITADIWGLHPSDFGTAQSMITTVLDVRAFLTAKMRALRSHRTQIGERHLFSVLSNDLALAFLGREFFVQARGEGDLLARTVAGGPDDD